ETPEESEEETEEEPEEETPEESEEETEEEPEEGTLEESEEEPEEEPLEESDEETPKDDLPEDSTEESSEELENTETKPPEIPVTDVHKHSWSDDWSYDGTGHWHECSAEDCPVADDSKKDGYAEHIYDDYGVCTECGYDAMDGIAVASIGEIPSYQEAYETMIELKDQYPEGMTWTNFEPYGSKGKLGSAYTWKGGPIYGAKSAVGCMAFAFILSDQAFGNLPARPIKRGEFTFEDVKVGDILRVNSNSHSVIVLQKSAGGVIVAEANFKKTVHWGRAMSATDVKNADFIITRYPEGYASEDEPDADDIVKEGKAGNLNWTLTSAKVLTISGQGTIPNYSSSNKAPWGNEVFTIVIEDGVTGIGNYAFNQSRALSVYIPDSVTAIGENAFSQSGLVAVTIPGTVETIGNSAFSECENLTSATVSEGVESIGDEAFYGCTSLTYIDFPASITSVGSGAFMSCGKMTRVRFVPGSGTVSIGDNLFSQCQYLTDVTLPKTIDRISAGMFQSCTALPKLYIPASVQEVGEEAFFSCKFLKTIDFGGSETQWNNMVPRPVSIALQQQGTKINYNVEFDDPFAAEPNDPGDFQPSEDGVCANHVDADKDGKCDNCGKEIAYDPPGPDDDENNPDGSGGGDKPPITDGSGNGDKPPITDGSGNGDKPPITDGSGNGDKPPITDGSGGGSKPPATDGSSGSPGGGPNGSDDSSVFDKIENTTIFTTSKWGSDSSHTAAKTQGDETAITVTTDETGKTAIEVRLSMLEIHTDEKNNEAAVLPIPAVQAVKDASMAPAITVYTDTDQLAKVAIPTIGPTAGTVAIIVNADGSTTIIPGSVPTENSVVAYLPNGITVKIVDNSKDFSDVPDGAWFADAVSFISARELFDGTTETEFAPNAPMTGAVLMTALARLDGVQTDDSRSEYEKAMEWAAARGMADGSDPNSPVTSEQLVTMLWKYQGSPVAADGLSGYGDTSSISDTQKAMDWAAKNGIVGVFGDGGTLAPQMQVNRSQAAQVIMNLVKKNTLNSAQ
ncbi:MAG: leucine-rich repeat protein, partial [Lachnospiraceae bacterium]|nr:leucine-rich repeat protein [Lachnospiraceae bacterium]